MAFIIENTISGLCLGPYDGETDDDAWAALCADAGYSEPEPRGDDIHIYEATLETSTTLDPVEVGGLYEHDNGTVGMYSWRQGELQLDWIAAGWTTAWERKERACDLPEVL